MHIVNFRHQFHAAFQSVTKYRGGVQWLTINGEEVHISSYFLLYWNEVNV